MPDQTVTQPPPDEAAARERRIGLLCALGVLVAWTGFLLSGRLATRQALTSWDMAALRFAGSFLGALPIVLLRGWPRLPVRRGLALAASAGLGYALPVYAAFHWAPTSHSGVMLIGMLPFVTAALAAVVLGERWGARRLISLAVVAAGIVLLAAATLGDHLGAWIGDGLFVLAAVFWSVYTLLVRHWRVPALTAVLSVALWPAFFYLPIWWLLLPSRVAEAGSGAVALQFVYQGFVAALLASFLFTRAVNALGAGTATTVTALVPALATLAAWPLLGEPPGLAGLAGVALVSAGILFGVLGSFGAARR
ncbi:DMT family transporter [Roseomonas elaeocarpi]|uniref:DMT family transporter n=1 Tax=Roseomonas elaeocarpi TaxID=907779 RepID=A0ABV6JPY8_9PROT